MSFIKAIFGDQNSKTVKKLEPLVAQINALEASLAKLSNDALKQKTADFKLRLTTGASLDDILPEAFAVVREAAKRTLNQRHFDVQLIGGMVLHQGGIAEMRTGEGKTLVATLPAYLNALTGKGVHIVTVNDYLSKRDAVWMGQVYNLLGLSVGVINHDASYLYDPEHQDRDQERDVTGGFKIVNEFLRPVSRMVAYTTDITYGTNNEFGFDYLRDNLEYQKDRLRQIRHHFAIVDEIDSILIDEARTPLIISSLAAESGDFYRQFAQIAKSLKPEAHYLIEEKHRAATLTDAGITEAERMLGIDNIYTEKGIKYVHHLETAVRAEALFHKDKEYVVREGEVVIVDEFTGRMQPGRRWSDGLHQAIEAKEGVAIQRESRTVASITFQNYFRMYEKLSGMTGTAETSAEEFRKVYNLEVTVVPTNVPTARTDHDDFIFQTEQGKFKAVARQVKELNQKGQPVLIGTVSIEKNELLSEYLSREGVAHQTLNAKNHEREGEIVAQAGRRGAVTIATNMAGRGVDIKLGGNPASSAEYQAVKELGGLFVLGTERHEARRIDNQLRGRSGRQGDPGATQFFVSLEDTLMRVFASELVKNMMGRVGLAEDEPIQNKIITRSLESAQKKIEGLNFDARKHLLDFDNVMNYQRQIVYERRRGILLGNDEVVNKYLEEISTDAVVLAKEALVTKREQLGGEFIPLVRQLILQATDLHWIEHLEMMDYLRSSVNLRAYGQRDPLVEYKKEGLRLFKEMQLTIEDDVLKMIPNLQGAGLATPEALPLQEVHKQAQMITGGTSGEEYQDKTPESRIAQADKPAQDPKFKGVGRNDPCPCGSGKKFKKCHGK